MGSFRCKSCWSPQVLFTPGGVTCNVCGGQEIETPGEDEAVWIPDQAGQIIELARMFSLADPRSA
ncbi:hypothetical protein DYQ86_17500 [Acidobacteria bacterium AB60]|nr:hypothetical protein DYQ86_17500 [Acidobacteria bacterium AB60]